MVIVYVVVVILDVVYFFYDTGGKIGYVGVVFFDMGVGGLPFGVRLDERGIILP